jgi:hypothetical protein
MNAPELFRQRTSSHLYNPILPPISFYTDTTEQIKDTTLLWLRIRLRGFALFGLVIVVFGLLVYFLFFFRPSRQVSISQSVQPPGADPVVMGWRLVRLTITTGKTVVTNSFPFREVTVASGSTHTAIPIVPTVREFVQSYDPPTMADEVTLILGGQNAAGSVLRLDLEGGEHFEYLFSGREGSAVVTFRYPNQMPT